MGYTAYHNLLGKAFRLEKDVQHIEGSGIAYMNFDFNSSHINHLPGSGGIPVIEKDFLSGLSDQEIHENIHFRYPVFLPEGKTKVDKAIILLHGLNEKSWDKYLPWARDLAIRTGSAVILFPISFHMNRTPGGWGNPRSMMGLSSFRQHKYEHQRCSSFANAAMSERLDNMPERFALSGYQSIMDLLALVNNVSSGRHPIFKENSEIHFFGYSIGAFLTQVMMIANPGGVFDKSRIVLFAGGTMFSEINGISRFILDEQAFTQLRKYYLNESSWRRKALKSYVEVMDVKHIARAFMAMLSPRYFQSLRSEVFSKFRDQTMVIALEEDHVFPLDTILRTFEGTGVNVNRVDFPFSYTHEIPFPIFKDQKTAGKVDENFDEIFTKAGVFLNE